MSSSLAILTFSPDVQAGRDARLSAYSNAAICIIVLQSSVLKRAKLSLANA